MSTLDIDATHPSSSINLSVLLKLLDKLLDLADRNSIVIGKDEYILLNEMRWAVTTGVGSTNTVSNIQITY